MTNDGRQYSGIAAEQGKYALAGVRQSVFAAVGAGDVLVARAIERGQRLATRTQAIAGTLTRPSEVRTTVTSAVQSAGGQAVEALQTLSKRGAEVVHELRKDPRVQRVILRVERGVDSVEGSVTGVLDDVATDVDDAAGGTKKVTRRAKKAVAESAETTRGAVRKTAARNTTARKSTTRTAPARKAPARKAPARNTAARTAAPGGTTQPAGKAVAAAAKATSTRASELTDAATASKTVTEKAPASGAKDSATS